METQLLCTFCTEDSLPSTLIEIKNTYDVVFDTIYVLQDIDSSGDLCCTFNIKRNKSNKNVQVLPGTISLHRKKATNTLYTINALNMLIRELNDGILDKKFSIPWENYRNTILVTAHGNLKKISTKLKQKIKTDDII